MRTSWRKVAREAGVIPVRNRLINPVFFLRVESRDLATGNRSVDGTCQCLGRGHEVLHSVCYLSRRPTRAHSTLATRLFQHVREGAKILLQGRGTNVALRGPWWMDRSADFNCSMCC